MLSRDAGANDGLGTDSIRWYSFAYKLMESMVGRHINCGW